VPRPAVTGTLTLRYLRGTRLGQPLRAEARVDRVDGAKTFAVGEITDAEGATVTAEGIFIQPKKFAPAP
jgi:acyl-coenzyme A thioesterase PaaI-like protein